MLENNHVFFYVGEDLKHGVSLGRGLEMFSEGDCVFEIAFAAAVLSRSGLGDR